MQTVHSYDSLQPRFSSDRNCQRIEVDVIIPVHNAAATIRTAVQSALSQYIPNHLLGGPVSASPWWVNLLIIHVCCYDDGSSDSSWDILSELYTQQQRQCEAQKERQTENSGVDVATTDTRTLTLNDQGFSVLPATTGSIQAIPTKLWIARGQRARGAGYARNRAAELRLSSSLDTINDDSIDDVTIQRFLCLLDSDDCMHHTRVAEQVGYLLEMDPIERQRTLLGCTFQRDPPNSTWHYTNWANSLSDERLHLERFREVTLLQPTWMLSYIRFRELGGYIEAPLPASDESDETNASGCIGVCHSELIAAHTEKMKVNHKLCLIHPEFDSATSLRLAEDLRFFQAHLYDLGILRLLRTDTALVTYRHNCTSQSSHTSRKLLCQLRVMAWERTILVPSSPSSGGADWNAFAIWGAGRDGKDFVKSLSPEARKRVYCFVDVDERKIAVGEYVHAALQIRIPIIHFTRLAANPEIIPAYGRIDKGRSDTVVKEVMGSDAIHPSKKRKRGDRKVKGGSDSLDANLLAVIPVIVCVAMYRTNGALEQNVQSIGRIEGYNLWFFN